MQQSLPLTADSPILQASHSEIPEMKTVLYKLPWHYLYRCSLLVPLPLSNYQNKHCHLRQELQSSAVLPSFPDGPLHENEYIQ